MKIDVFAKNFRWTVLLLPILVAQQCSGGILPTIGAFNTCRTALPTGSYVIQFNDATVSSDPGMTTCVAPYLGTFWAEGFVALESFMVPYDVDMIHNVAASGMGTCDGLPIRFTERINGISIVSSCGYASKYTDSGNVNLVFNGRQQATWFFPVR